MFRSTILAVSLLTLSSVSFAQFGGTGGPSGDSSSHNRDSQRLEESESTKQYEKFLDDESFKLMKKSRPKFGLIFSQAQNAIMKDDLKKAEGLIAKLHEFKSPNLYEESRLYLADYWLYGKQGNKELEYEAASKLLAVGAGNIDSQAFVEAGMRLLKRQYNNQDLGGAIETLNNLRKEPASQAELMPILSVVKKLDDFSEQQTDIVQKITTNETGVWSAKLFRPHFFFNGISGEISTLGFNCANKQATINYKADSVMEIPEAWGSCTMKVTAKPNTTFNLVQLQKKPA